MSLFTKFFFFILTAAHLTCLAQNLSSYQLKAEAEEYLSAGKLGEAIDLLNKYISAVPEQAEGYFLRAGAFEKRGNYESAMRDYRSASKLEPSNRNYSANLIRAQETWNKILANRIEGHKREIVINPANPKNYLEIGKSYKHLEDWESSERWYDEYLKREEASADEILRYTEVLTKLKKFSKGIPILKRYTLKYPEDHRIWSRYGYFNLWLGNKKAAIEAFEESLKIRPFFREAMEGLDQAKGKGYNYTYTTSRKGEVYLIDKYYKDLKSSPGDNTKRLMLVNKLFKHKRYEEAYQQLEIIRSDSSKIQDTDSLWTLVNEQRRQVHIDRIEQLRAQYDKGKINNDLLLQLARRYSYIEEYDSSAFFYLEYLRSNPSDLSARFEYAKVLAWNLDYEGSKKEVSLLLELDPDNADYQLLYATLSVWMLQDLDKAEDYLLKVLNKDPNNLDALISAVSLYILKKDFVSAEDYLYRAQRIDPQNQRVVKIASDLDFHKLRAEEEKVFQILETGRELAMQNKCQEALKKYEEYLAQVEPSQMVQKEYADVLACAGYFDKALSIYDQLLAVEYSFETDLQRAKVYYWSGDSLKALEEFTRLYKTNPDNFDVQLYLGDVYTKLKMYPEAEKIFDTMLASGLDSSRSELVTMRKGWLPAGGGALGLPPGLLMLTPSALYYADNIDFTYNQQSLRADINLSSFMTVAVDGSFGFLSSESLRNSFKGFRGMLLFRFFKDRFLFGGGAGTTMFNDLQETLSAEAFVRYEKPEVYSASFTFNHSDAAFILYSPELVDERWTTNLFRLAGYYRFPSGIRLSGYGSAINVSDGNTGYFLELEAGMHFNRRFYAAYEFYAISWEQTSARYFSPSDYSTHSLLAEYDFVKEKINRLTLGGKLGLISNSDYLLREIFVAGMYNIVSSLTAQARISYGSTLQYDLGYSSFAAQLAFYWML